MNIVQQAMFTLPIFFVMTPPQLSKFLLTNLAFFLLINLPRKEMPKTPEYGPGGSCTWWSSVCQTEYKHASNKHSTNNHSNIIITLTYKMNSNGLSTWIKLSKLMHTAKKHAITLKYCIITCPYVMVGHFVLQLWDKQV